MADGARRKPQSGTKREQAIDDVPTHNGAWATPGFVLWHASLRWQQEATKSLARHDLTYAQFTLLAGIWWLRRQVGGVPPSQRELADHTGISPMMTSQVLRRLEAQQLVERVHDEGDTRVRRITLTDAGAALARKSIATLDKADRAFFADVALVPDALVATLLQVARRDPQGRRTEGARKPRDQ